MSTQNNFVQIRRYWLYNNDTQKFIASYEKRNIKEIIENACFIYFNYYDSQTLKLRIYDFLYKKNYLFICVRKKIRMPETLIDYNNFHKYIYTIKISRMHLLDYF